VGLKGSGRTEEFSEEGVHFLVVRCGSAGGGMGWRWAGGWGGGYVGFKYVRGGGDVPICAGGGIVRWMEEFLGLKVRVDSGLGRLGSG